MDRKLIKKISKQTLTGNYANAIGFLLIITAINLAATFLVEFIPLVGSFATLFIGSLIAISQGIFFKTLSETRQKVRYKECIPDMMLSLKFLCCSVVISIIAALIMIVPILTIFASFWLSMILIFLVSIALGFLLMPPMEMLVYILLDNPEMSITAAFKLSFKYFFDNFSDFIVLVLSLIPLTLLVVITFGIAILWVGPYMSTIWYNAYKQVSGQDINPSANNYFYN